MTFFGGRYSLSLFIVAGPSSCCVHLWKVLLLIKPFVSHCPEVTVRNSDNNYIARQQFGNLQHKTFPIYFQISIGLSSVLLGLWVYFHPAVKSHYLNVFAVDVIQAYTLLSVALMQSTNYFVIGPLTSKFV